MDDHENMGHENMCDDRSQNDLQHPTDVHAKTKNNRPGQSRKISEIKTDRRSQETITVNR